MHQTEMEKHKQLNTLLFVLKLLGIFFSVIPLIQRIFHGTAINDPFSSDYIVIVAFMFTGFSIALFFLVLISYNSMKKDSHIIWVELPIFLIMIITAISLSGSYKSDYKFLFIFVIVSYSIEYSMQVGLIIAAVASAFVLGIDLVFGNTGEVNPYFENDIALVAMFIMVAVTIGLYSRMERQHIDYLKHYANLDGLTEIYNHRYFHQKLDQKCKESDLEKTPISLLMLDIDYFKIYNDMYGHQKGDSILKEMVSLLRQNINNSDILCRYGGEEFSIILPNTDLNEAIRKGNQIREAVAEYQFDGENALPDKCLTVSIGVAQLYEKNDSAKELIYRADSALYRAKYLRRNRVEIYSSVIDQYNKENGHNDASKEAFSSLKTLISVINSRDSYTYSHIDRVVHYCELIADDFDLDSQNKRKLIYAAYLHDLGKINVSKEILISSTKLTDEQWNELKRHPSDGAEIISKLEGFEDIATIVLQHHERWDGAGYPNGVKGENILHLARILSIADCFDAMTNTRPYSQKRSFEEAFEEIRKCAGSQFDPNLTETFIKSISEASSMMYAD
ncbi:MAG: diguanylate cyclase domain protein [Oscillospiraceae bacterium]|nr:diguanylate cyclase domain protein [Oscillospiraceae bacterium]